MKWYYQLLIGIIIISVIAGLAYREKLIRQYPIYVRHYQKIMRKISSENYIEKLQNYTGQKFINYVHILEYLHERLLYTEDSYIERHEDPIEILEYGLGRCGEFTIAYTALCIASGYKARIVFDVSVGEGNGDHMWTEIKTIYGGHSEWIHIDPTEKRIFDPYMYERDWKKELTEVWAIEPYFAERIEENYQYE